MKVCETISEIRQVVAGPRLSGRTIAIVPTMGNLHAGHASLIDAAVADGHFVVVTIFVNPTQFGPGEDLDAYPRTPEADLQLCDEHSADAVFMPEVDQMYPQPGRTTVHVDGLTDALCGASRPTHFDGVCTVVTKLLHIVSPDAAYFGQKDAQQAAVIRRMIEDLDFPVRLVVCPTVREDDGLALSSRNRYLTPDERRQAAQLHQALQLAKWVIGEGRTDAPTVIDVMRRHLAQQAPMGEIEYIQIVDPDTLADVVTVTPPVLVALAVRFGKARLIDNLRVDDEGGRA